MKRLVGALDSLPFWIGVFIATVLFVFAYAFVTNRAATRDNAEILVAQSQQLAYLCETIVVLDNLNAQEARINRAALRDPRLGPLAPYLRQRALALGIAHQELSESRGCRRIE